jgi:calcineurin-like phosphoesterase family protein
MINEYFIADTHLGHTNIIKYSNRPFASVDEMDNTIIDNVNKVVKANDILYHLGDVVFGNIGRVIGYIKRINCKNIRLILGNHDKVIRKDIQYFLREFEWIHDFKEIKSLSGQSITLCHYALKVWNRSHYGSWHLYGHSHHSLPDDPNSLSFDVGVDGWNFKPLHFDEVKQIISKKKFVPVDHHI